MTAARLSSSTPAGPAARARRLHVGAEIVEPGRVHFRVWAPAADELEVVVNDRASALQPEGNEYFSAEVDAAAGDRYGFRVNASERLYPDPASRYQPDGPHGL